MAYGRISVEEIAYNGLVVYVSRNTAEAIILGYIGEKIFAIVLTDGLNAPRHTVFHKLACGVGTHHNLVVGRGDTHKAVFG